MQGLEARLRSLAAFLSSSYRKGAKARSFAGSPAASQATGGGFGSMVGDGGDSVGGLPPAKRQRMEHVFRLEDHQCAPNSLCLWALLGPGAHGLLCMSAQGCIADAAGGRRTNQAGGTGCCAQPLRMKQGHSLKDERSVPRPWCGAGTGSPGACIEGVMGAAPPLLVAGPLISARFRLCLRCAGC